MVSRGRQYLAPAPVIVEVKPGHAGTKSNMAPASPTGSPKAVRFAPDGLIKARPLLPAEAWSFYHFETHARQCHVCFNPKRVHAQGSRLCSTGHSLAQDVAIHVYLKDGEVYSTKKDNHKHVRLELEPGYDQLRQLLQTMVPSSRTPSPPAFPVSSPTISYGKPATYSPTYTRNEVIIEPAHTLSTHRSKHRSTRYRPVIVNDELEDDIQPITALPVRSPTRTLTGLDERRGSLYVKDMQRPRDKAYRVEIREPADVRNERERRRRSTGYWN